MSSSSSPCAACRYLRQKCSQDCVFAPYFPVDQPDKFVSVHQVFGRKNVAKILRELNVTQREDAVRSLVYEADARLNDPIYGCVGLVSILQQRLKQLHHELYGEKEALATYVGPQAMASMLHSPPTMLPPQQQVGNPSSSSSAMPMPMTGVPAGPVHRRQLVIHEPQQQQIFQDQQETHNNRTDYEEQLQQQVDNLRFSSCGTGFEEAGAVTATGFQPPFALGTIDGENPYHVQPQAEHHQQLPGQLFLLPQQQPPEIQ